jgi:spermidine synthase
VARSLKANPSQAPISFAEVDGVRYLHFGTKWVQGAMRLKKPNVLELDYCKHMMVWLLFLEPPMQCLQLGLGAASLTKFAVHHFADTECTVVDWSAQVAAAAHAAFALPRDCERLNIVIADANEFMLEQSKTNRYGVVQVDLYDFQANGPVCDSLAFYQAIQSSMSAQGSMMTVNLFGDHPSFDRNLERINQAFDQRVICLEPLEEGNTIALGFNGPPLQVPWAQLYERAAVVEQLYGLKARGWVNSFKRSRPGAGFCI